MEVQKKSGITYEEFVEEHYKPRIPVVLQDVFKDWKAKGLITPEYLRDNFSDRSTGVAGINYTVAELIDLVAKSTPENPAPYPAIFEIRKSFPELMPLINPVDMGFAKPNWLHSGFVAPGKLGNCLELFIGGGGCQYPFAHIDQYYTNAWITQVYGEKHITVFPQGQDEFLYPQPHDKHVSQVNIFNPDYEKHPLFKNATPVKVSVMEGETIFIPRGTWHSASSPGTNISVIFDQMNSINYSHWKKDVWAVKRKRSLKSAVFSYGYASLMGTYCQFMEALGML